MKTTFSKHLLRDTWSVCLALVSVLGSAVAFADGPVSAIAENFKPAPPPHAPGAQTVELPAGSVDGLAAAIAAAGPRGTVIVKSGMHTESDGVMITMPVNILGEAGAMMQFDLPPTLTIPAVVDPAFHVKDTRNVVISGLEVVPAGPIGNTAFLLEQADNAWILDNTITDFQWSVIAQKGKNSWISGNIILASPAWITGEIPESDGIVVTNGFNFHIVDNVVSNALLGIFAGGEKGRAIGNLVTGNFIGFILCTLVPDFFEFPDGSLVGADFAARGWLVQGNTATGNFDAGFLVIDGANNNVLTNNAGDSNGTYDIELAGDSFRFGFFTPTSLENTVNAGSHPEVVIKDCGLDNAVHGGVPVDSDIDPCF